MTKKRLVFLVKLAFSVGVVALIYGKVVGREGAGELWARAREIHWGWVLGAVAMQLAAVVCSVIRWDLLLRGQGIRAPFRHLFGSFLVGRFFGAFTPAGLGLQGYRLYDIAVQTGKAARSAATIGIEMVLGWLAFGAVVIAGSIFGARFVGVKGVLLIDLGFLVLIAAAILLITRPTLFRVFAGFLPHGVRVRLQTTVDAVCAYHGRGMLVTKAALLGMGTHAFNNLIYVCAAQSLGVDLGVGEVFFASAIQIFSTLMPVSINGVGLREATAVALYSAVGIPLAVAVLIPTVGFAAEMAVSSLGGFVFLARRVGYRATIEVEAPEQEQYAEAAILAAPRETWPRMGRGTAIGLGGGFAGGVWLGAGEALVILSASKSAPDWGVLVYAGALYGALFACVGAGLGFALAWSGRLMRRARVAEPVAFGRVAAALAATGAFGIGAFRVRRDMFHEDLRWKSVDGLLVLGGCTIAAAVLYVALSFLARRLVARRPLSVLLRAWGAPAALGGLVAAAAAIVLVNGHAGAAPAAPSHANPTRPSATGGGNVLFIVVDTLRADHLPAYGYRAIRTPHLDAFTADAVRFEQAFANASWTRPSFASILTGRYPSSHRTTTKPDALPDEIVTLAEAYRDAGHGTLGIVTNYNVAPFFNFHQGFDRYVYLEPEFVLGANDTAAKLLLVQFLRQKIERRRASSGRVARGSAYQDAEVVNAEILRMLDAQGQAPWFFFAAYMDPHDPYYPHPYDGTGYARAANARPKPEEAARMIDLYDGEIVYWDEHFGRLIAELKRRGLYDASTIVITSDHGEEFMDHGGFWHGATLYDEQLRVPLLVKLPKGERAGSVVSHWVESVDIMPTLLARARIDVPRGVQGKDLWQGSESAFAEEDHEGNVLRALRLRRGTEALKVIEANPGNPRGLEPFELFRVEQDPGEQVNLAREEEDVLRIAAGRLEVRGREAVVGRVGKRSVDVAGDADSVEKLRALGYAGGDK
jgi:arylsulfatase A-like enzyme/uncharacterized membrane protein YbhN (UPF0104 family)